MEIKNLEQLENLITILNDEQQKAIKGGNIIIEDDVIN